MRALGMLGSVLITGAVAAAPNFLPGQPVFTFSGTGSIRSLASADLDGDGDRDIVAISTAGGTGERLQVLLNDGSGHFTAGQVHASSPLGETLVHALADIDGDSRPDLVALVGVFNPAQAGELLIFPGDGSGGFYTPQSYAAPAQGRTLHIADLDGDGDPDLLVQSDDHKLGPDGMSHHHFTVHLFRNDAGTFRQETGFELTEDHYAIAVIDHDGDGYPDIILRSSRSGTDTRWLRNVAGQLQTQEVPSEALPPGVLWVSAGDGDEVITISPSESSIVDGEDLRCSVRIHGRAPAGALQSAPATPVHCPRGVPAVADIDGDGRVELASATDLRGTPFVVYQRVAAGFVQASRFRATSDFSLHDFDGDGRVDLLSAQPFWTGPPLDLLVGTDRPNQPPVALGGTFEPDPDGVVRGFVYAADADDNPLNFAVVAPPRKDAALVLDFVTGEFRYELRRGRLSGLDSFEVLVSDRSGGSSRVTVNLDLGPGGGGGSPDPLTFAGLLLAAGWSARRRLLRA